MQAWKRVASHGRLATKQLELLPPSYTITVPKAAELDAATRRTRVLPKVKWSAQLAGALIATEIGGTLNY